MQLCWWCARSAAAYQKSGSCCWGCCAPSRLRICWALRRATACRPVRVYCFSPRPSKRGLHARLPQLQDRGARPAPGARVTHLSRPASCSACATLRAQTLASSCRLSPSSVSTPMDASWSRSAPPSWRLPLRGGLVLGSGCLAWTRRRPWAAGVAPGSQPHRYRAGLRGDQQHGIGVDGQAEVGGLALDVGLPLAGQVGQLRGHGCLEAAASLA